MYGWFRHILVLSATLLLALPPGWCCFMPRQTQASTRPEGSHDCCHGSPVSPHHPTAPDRDEAPVAPATSCCCVTDATSPADPQTPAADPSSVPLAVPVGDVSLSPASHPFIRDVQPHAPSPPPRILHCVWLC
jgi:hypothetical protein